VDAYASTGEAGNWTSWGGLSGSEYCIDPVNSFEHGYRYHCGARKLESVSFKEIDNPWRTQEKGTYTWNLGGDPTHLKICNNAGQRIWGALSKSENGHWITRGWFEYQPNQCRDWNLGIYRGSVYIFGENDGVTKVWQSNVKPQLCVYEGTAFTSAHNGGCGKGGKLVGPNQFVVNAGMNTWTYQP
jgi:uncharacterized membrane protein